MTRKANALTRKSQGVPPKNPISSFRYWSLAALVSEETRDSFVCWRSLG